MTDTALTSPSTIPSTRTGDPIDLSTRASRRRARTRERLVDAAAEALGQKGVAAATIADITETADVGLGTFYNYFDSKEAILSAVTEKVATLLCADLRTAVSAHEDPADRLSAAVQELFHWYSRETVWGPFLLTIGLGHEALTRQFGGLLVELVQAGVAAGRFDRKDAELAPITIAGGLVAGLEFLSSGWVPLESARGFAVQLLRAVGVPSDEAETVASRTHPTQR